MKSAERLGHFGMFTLSAQKNPVKTGQYRRVNSAFKKRLVGLVDPIRFFAASADGVLPNLPAAVRFRERNFPSSSSRNIESVVAVNRAVFGFGCPCGDSAASTLIVLITFCRETLDQSLVRPFITIMQGFKRAGGEYVLRGEFLG